MEIILDNMLRFKISIIHKLLSLTTVAFFVHLDSSIVLLRKASSVSIMEKDYKKLALLVIPVTTFALGTWQIFRLQRKVRLIEDLERKTAIPPMQIPAE